ncbi:uncharacterized protein LOC135843921 [Planococcus citri]|uniref:uncharacterized protein LOC135843921 n=1 Tax=Planococcus citri TaxID=170843 RepID=UPI0031F7FA3E
MIRRILTGNPLQLKQIQFLNIGFKSENSTELLKRGVTYCRQPTHVLRTYLRQRKTEPDLDCIINRMENRVDKMCAKFDKSERISNIFLIGGVFCTLCIEFWFFWFCSGHLKGIKAIHVEQENTRKCSEMSSLFILLNRSATCSIFKPF